MAIERRHCWFALVLFTFSIALMILIPDLRLATQPNAKEQVSKKFDLTEFQKPNVPASQTGAVAIDMVAARNHPLFNRARAPFVAQSKMVEPVIFDLPVAEAQPAIESEVRSDSAILRGVRLDADKKSALIEFNGDNQPQWYEIGATVDQWQLLSVFADQVEMLHQGRTIELKLYVDNSKLSLGVRRRAE